MNVNGVELIDRDDMVVKAVDTNGLFEFDSFSQWIRFVNRNRNAAVVDVGSYTGVYAIGAALHCAHENVYAIEPNPTTFERLNENIKANGVDVVAVSAAVSHHDAPRYVMLGLKKSTVMTSAASISISPDIHTHSVSVPCLPLDLLVVGPVGVIKIDVENHEMDVLRGATDILRAHHPSLIIEALTDAQGDEITKYLVDTFGYELPTRYDGRNLVFEE